MSLGSIPTQDVTGAWWQGGNEWVKYAEEGTLTWEVADSLLTVASSEADAFLGHYLDLDGPDTPATLESWSARVRFRLDVAGDELDPGERYLSFTARVAGVEATWQVRFGDGSYAQGVRIASGAGSDFAAKALELGEWHYLRMDFRGGVASARLWQVDDPEPASADVERDAEDNGYADTFTLDISLGNDGGYPQTLDIEAIWFRASYFAVEAWAGEWFGGVALEEEAYGTWRTTLPYAADSLLVTVGGTVQPATQSDPASGEFLLPDDPADMVVRAWYRVPPGEEPAPPDDDEGEVLGDPEDTYEEDADIVDAEDDEAEVDDPDAPEDPDD